MNSKYYTIGEISTIMNVSAHTLRYYDKIGLLKPGGEKNPNGYRMYSYEQIFALERIKYLQHIGFSLEEIKEIFDDNTTVTLYKKLAERKKIIEDEISRLTAQKSVVENYQKYFNQVYDRINPGIPFKTHFGERFMLYEAYAPGEDLLGTAGIRLTSKRSRQEYADLEFQRQIGLVLDYQSLLDGNAHAKGYYIFLEDAPIKEYKDVISIPEGDYLCLRTRLFDDHEKGIISLSSLINEAFGETVVIACELDREMSDNPESWKQSLFEIQVLL